MRLRCGVKRNSGLNLKGNEQKLTLETNKSNVIKKTNLIIKLIDTIFKKNTETFYQID